MYLFFGFRFFDAVDLHMQKYADMTGKHTSSICSIVYDTSIYIAINYAPPSFEKSGIISNQTLLSL